MLLLAALAFLLVTTVALAATGDLTQPAGTAGCLSDTATSGCAQGHQLLGTRSVAVSPDGKNVYVASQSTVARIDRDTTTGALSQPAGAAGCISETGVGGVHRRPRAQIPCPGVGGQRGREERLRHLLRQQRRGAP